MSNCDVLPIAWDGGLIAVSYFIAVQAAYTAVQILQLRVSRWLVVLGAFCLSTSGIWAMHFIGMAAFSMHADVGYDAGWTVASALFAFVPCAAAMLLVHHKVDYVETDDASLSANLEALRRAPHGWVLFSGVCIAFGVTTMHYTGMHAMQTAASVAMVIDWGVLAASCVIAVVASEAALYCAFILPLTRRYTIPTSLVMGVAVSGMHYTGMYAMRHCAAAPIPLSTMTHTNAIASSAVYIAFIAGVVNFCSLAITSHLYRRDIRAAEGRARAGVDLSAEVAGLVARYDMDGALAAVKGAKASASCDPRLHEQFHAMLTNLEPYRAYLPQSLFAVHDTGRCDTGSEGPAASEDGDGSDDDDDALQDVSLSFGAAPHCAIAVGEAAGGSLIELSPSLVSTDSQSQLSVAADDDETHSAVSSYPTLAHPPPTGAGRTHFGKTTTQGAGMYSPTGRGGGGGGGATSGHKQHNATPVVQRPATAGAAGKGAAKGGPSRPPLSPSRAHVAAPAVTTRAIVVLVTNIRRFHRTLAGSGLLAAQRQQEALLSTMQVHARSQGGIVDSFHGDHVVTTWNASAAVAQRYERAFAAALHIAEATAQQQVPVTCGMGFGTALVGNMGTHAMRRFCVIGDVVKDAHVLERLAKRYPVGVTGSGASPLCGGTVLFPFPRPGTEQSTAFANAGFTAECVDIVGLPSKRRAAAVIALLRGRNATSDIDWMYELQADGPREDGTYAPVNSAFLCLQALAGACGGDGTESSGRSSLRSGSGTSGSRDECVNGSASVKGRGVRVDAVGPRAPTPVESTRDKLGSLASTPGGTGTGTTEGASSTLVRRLPPTLLTDLEDRRRTAAQQRALASARAVPLEGPPPSGAPLTSLALACHDAAVGGTTTCGIAGSNGAGGGGIGLMTSATDPCAPCLSDAPLSASGESQSPSTEIDAVPQRPAVIMGGSGPSTPTAGHRSRPHHGAKSPPGEGDEMNSVTIKRYY